MSSAGTAGREAVFQQLRRRHALVRLLRIAVPLIGILAFAALAAQIYIASFGGVIGAEGLRLERDRLVVDRPTMTGTLAGLGSYELVADTASTQLSAATGVALDAIEASMLFLGGATAEVRAVSGRFEFGSRLLHTGERVDLTTSDGIRGEANGARLELPTQIFTADGGVSFHFPDGSTLEAELMVYDANRGSVRFEGVRLIIQPAQAAVAPQAAQ
ncbi:MAG: hypothetical protein WD017_03910 [Cucumibacter sp.]